MSADYEKLGLFYLGKQFDLEKGTRLDDLVLYDSRDLLTHAVCVGMTGSGKTGLGISLIEEAAIDGIPVLAIDPKGDLGNLLLTFPNLAPGGLRAVDRCRRGAATRHDGRRVRRRDRAAMEGRSRGVGPGRRAHRTSEGRGRRHRLHARKPDRHAAGDPRIARASRRRRRRGRAVRHRHHGLESARSGRHRGRAAAQPRAGAARGDPVEPPDARRRARICDGSCSRFSGRRSTASACSTSRRSFRRASGRNWRFASTACSPHRASTRGAPASRSTRRRCSSRRRASRASPSSRSRIWTTAAHARGVAGAQCRAAMDAAADRDELAACARLHGRSVRLSAAGRQSAVEAAAADAAEAGARVWRGPGAGDTEPGRSRLQGAVEYRHLVPRQAADRARQGADARWSRGRVVGSRSAGDRSRAVVAQGTRVPDAQRPRAGADRVRDALGTVLSPRADGTRGAAPIRQARPRAPRPRRRPFPTAPRRRHPHHPPLRRRSRSCLRASRSTCCRATRAPRPSTRPSCMAPRACSTPTRSAASTSTRSLQAIVSFVSGPIPVDWERAEETPHPPETLDDAVRQPRRRHLPLPPAALDKKRYAAWTKDFSSGSHARSHSRSTPCRR